MACRNCGLAQPLAVAYVCPACFGPLEVTYDYDVVAATLTREAIASSARRDLALPRAAPGRRRRRLARYRSARPPCSARTAWPRSWGSIGSGSRTTPGTRRCPSRIDRRRSLPPARSSSAVPALACASTGNLAGATAAAAAAVGLPAYVFIPADLETAKVDHALPYGATVVPIDGTYDDVNRLCLEIADETGWGFVNINLRPFYAEGSKTLAYEIAESLGWRQPGRGRRSGRVRRDVHAGSPAASRSSPRSA